MSHQGFVPFGLKHYTQCKLIVSEKIIIPGELVVNSDAPTIDACYLILDVPDGSTLAVVRLAYRELALVWHPDRFEAGSILQAKAERKLVTINEAYDILSTFLTSSEKRASYSSERQETRSSKHQGRTQGSAQFSQWLSRHVGKWKTRWSKWQAADSPTAPPRSDRRPLRNLLLSCCTLVDRLHKHFFGFFVVISPLVLVVTFLFFIFSAHWLLSVGYSAHWLLSVGYAILASFFLGSILSLASLRRVYRSSIDIQTDQKTKIGIFIAVCSVLLVSAIFASWLTNVARSG